MHHLLIILDLKHLFLPDCSLVLISTLLLNTKVLLVLLKKKKKKKVLLVKVKVMLFYSPCYKNVCETLMDGNVRYTTMLNFKYICWYI